NEGLGTPAYTILPPGMPGYDESIGMPPYDPQAAREALAASAYADSLPEITLLEAGYASGEDDFTTAVLNMWEETLGVQVSVEYIDPLKMTEIARETPAHLVSYGWCADYPDPQNFLDVLFRAGSDFNVTHYDNPQVNALLEKANTTFDPAMRLTQYQQAERLILEDVAAIPLLRGERFVLVSDRLDGYQLAPIGVPIWDLVQLKP
ncbi:MAG TPA: peptide ABC transporter substrate-binding protein, partial [Chloroflexi bacterium]|nr:peptide ABC transporter substrate-binding protein [Chloroflexota bacterium]